MSDANLERSIIVMRLRDYVVFEIHVYRTSDVDIDRDVATFVIFINSTKLPFKYKRLKKALKV